MSFNSVHFLFFFPIVVLCYFLIPKKIRWIWLLVTSYYFYMSWNPYYVVLMAFSTIVTYLTGLALDRENHSSLEEGIRNRRKKVWLVLCLIANFSILFIFKYFNFLNETLHGLLHETPIAWDIKNLDVLLPVGISFYTFEVISYTMDVYRGQIRAERNLAKYALFVSFFPKLVAGPIERATNLLPQFHEPQKFNYENLRSGLMLMLWGFFQKMVIADRVAILVNNVFNNVHNFIGFQYVVATLLFSIQILCDFSAYTDIATGASKILGFNLLDNFKQPYFATSIKDFWRRWHISLSSWFKDYLYFPLGGSKKGRLKTYRNIMIVFLVSGLWHGANWTFAIWGALHGIFQVSADVAGNFNRKLTQQLGLEKHPFSLKICQITVTFLLVSFGWIFFRANTIADAAFILKHLLVYNPEDVFGDGIYSLGLDGPELRIAIYAIVLLFIVQYLQTKMSLRKFVSSQWLPVRWSIYISSIVLIIFYGIYGPGYNASEFIYFQF